MHLRKWRNKAMYKLRWYFVYTLQKELTHLRPLSTPPFNASAILYACYVFCGLSTLSFFRPQSPFAIVFQTQSVIAACRRIWANYFLYYRTLLVAEFILWKSTPRSLNEHNLIAQLNAISLAVKVKVACFVPKQTEHSWEQCATVPIEVTRMNSGWTNDGGK